MKKKFRYIAGVDEVGRGALSGPVVASCVGFKSQHRLPLRDSKALTPQMREKLFDEITKVSHYSFGLVNCRVIDEVNIFWASQRAFLKAIEKQAVGRFFGSPPYRLAARTCTLGVRMLCPP